jgi:predicted DNA-binding protein (MmcQ/YjbR family)
MNVEQIREYCLSLHAVTESFPFDEVSLVFKVMGKIFCILNLEKEHSISIKNLPEKIMEMREEYPGVLPARHLDKNHWNLVMTESDIPDPMVKTWINESYNLVTKGLTKKQKEILLKPDEDAGI